MSLFEDQTYENLLASALARISPTLDKREGSMVYNGVAPAMAELAQLYIGLDFVFAATYIATAPREYLIMRASDRGISPYPASTAVFRAEFDVEVPIGTRFSCEELNFYVSERMQEKDTDSAKSYKLICETPGALANSFTGSLIPIEYIKGLTTASIAELLIPGDDEEETEAFRQRVLDSFKSQAFGGNQADYKEKVLAIDGVAAVKVHPVWNGDTSPSDFIPSKAAQVWYNSVINTISNADVKAWLTAVYAAAINKKLTVGGTVKLVIMAANNAAPSAELIDLVQTTIDPTQNAGEGLGLAPIGHVVNVVGVTERPVNIDLNLTFSKNWNWASSKSYIEAAIDDYFASLAKSWESTDNLTVRISHIESHILSECATMITDISETKINGIEANLILDSDSIPIRGVVNG